MAKQHEIEAKKAQLIDSYGPDGLAKMVIDLTDELEDYQAGAKAEARAGDQARRELAEVKADRDELAARVERLRSACQLGIDMMVGNNLSLPKTFETMCEAMNISNSEALAMVKAEAVREARDACCADIRWIFAARYEALTEYAQSLIDEAGE